MKIFRFILLYLIIFGVPCAAMYVVLDSEVLYYFLVLYSVLTLVGFAYMDKLVLMALKAREVIDTDEQNLFQSLKNESYKSFTKLPKIYLFSGDNISCFVLESRSEWTLVISRKLISQASPEQLNSLVKFIYEYNKNNSSWFRTKVMGLNICYLKGTYWFLQTVCFVKKTSKIFNVLATFILIMLRPFILPLNYLILRNELEYKDENFRAVINQVEQRPFSFYELIVSHMEQVQDTDKTLANYLENFSILNNVRLTNNEVA